MHWTRALGSGAALLTMVAMGCAEQPAPEAPPPPDILAAAPAGATVHPFDIAQWEEPACGSSTEMALDVPADAWVELPMGWLAVDEATSRANWEHMRYEVWLGDRQLEVPADVGFRVDSVSFACPSGTLAGAGLSWMLYLPPVSAERQYRVRYLFDEDVNDGFGTYAKGTDLTMNVTLRPTS